MSCLEAINAYRFIYKYSLKALSQNKWNDIKIVTLILSLLFVLSR